MRKLALSDFESFHKMQSDDEVMRFTGQDGNCTGLSEETDRRQPIHCIECYGMPHNAFFVWAIDNEAGDFVGTCAIVRTDAGGSEIGYRFLRKFWERDTAPRSPAGG